MGRYRRRGGHRLRRGSGGHGVARRTRDGGARCGVVDGPPTCVVGRGSTGGHTERSAAMTASSQAREGQEGWPSGGVRGAKPPATGSQGGGVTTRPVAEAPAGSHADGRLGSIALARAVGGTSVGRYRRRQGQVLRRRSGGHGVARRTREGGARCGVVDGPPTCVVGRGSTGGHTERSAPMMASSRAREGQKGWPSGGVRGAKPPATGSQGGGVTTRPVAEAPVRSHAGGRPGSTRRRGR